MITDMTMPGMTGDALNLAIKKIRPDIPVILCTGFSSLISMDRAKSLGIDKYLEKPVRIEVLASAVREILDGRRRT